MLAARLTEDPGTRVLLLEAGGGADKFLAQDAARHDEGDAQARADLADDDRARADAERPPPVPAARAAARRVELDQRHGLHARPLGRLRPLGAERRARLEPRRSAAVLPADGAQLARDRQLRRVGPAADHQEQHRLPAPRRADAGDRATPVYPVHRRHPRRRRGRRQLRRADDRREGPPGLDVRGLSQAGDAAAEPRGRHRRADPQGAGRGRPRDRRRIRSRRRSPHRRARAR